MHVEVGGVRLEFERGDIASQDDLEAVVNAANAELRTGGGVAGAIHRAAGPELEAACRPLAPIDPGEAVITDAFGLPNERVVHCLGPVYGRDEPADELLADCYHNALGIAEDEPLPSIGFPALSTGAFGYPTGEAAEVMLETFGEELPELSNVDLVRVVLWGKDAYERHREAAERVLN